MNGSYLNAVAVLIPLLEILGILAAIHAVMTVRTSQGAIAWSVFLITFPVFSLPLYAIFGRSKFYGYVQALRKAREQHAEQLAEIRASLLATFFSQTSPPSQELLPLQQLADLPFTGGNQVTLLVNGEATFRSMFEALQNARHYILLQSFIVRDDALGEKLKQILLRKAAEGVRVYFLFDSVGCFSLPENYWSELRAGGVQVAPFGTGERRLLRYQFNFRNHRKIAICDGTQAFVGGHNIGDEYRGRSTRLGPWRDTHVKMIGPVVQAIQVNFTADWYWATSQLLELEWASTPAPQSDTQVLALATGPADSVEKCHLMFLHCINSAKKRLWIASPYFVPSGAIISALQLAALRGVDVRILLPLKPDHIFVYLASFAYLPVTAQPGIQFYRYGSGFLHQKVLLVDDNLAGVGTANLDNRSLRLNFEITALIADREFAQQIERMLEADFEASRPVDVLHYRELSLPFRLAVRLASLLSPIL